ncbi:MAG: hypothetical protein A2Y93_18075 [Chloroflexi bacterium RBG_13_68_17]|nr:MAG: hypothetical protein A2Y93_18075 [Chloroflexi bacterium RBG_13_68_17]
MFNHGVCGRALRRGAARRGVVALCALGLAGCSLPLGGGPAGSGPATLTAVAVAIRTVATMPSTPITPDALPTESLPAVTQAASAAPATPPASPSICTDRASFVSDATIRDFSEIAPGAAFVKIWRLENAGTCTWTQEYALVFFGGERMSAASAVPLSATVGPGMQVDLPVDMLAPSAPGTYQSFWRLRSRTGALFGIGPGGNESFWVKIVVVAALTPSASPSPSPTVSPTPVVVAAGTVDLPAASSLDLDTGAVGPPSGADVSFLGSGAADGSLSPATGARLARYSPPPPLPGPVDCLSAPLSLDALPTAGLAPGSLVCYLTDQGRPGYFEVTDATTVLRLRYTTWNP